MSLKNALADLPFGGGKAVILRPSALDNREALFRSFGDAVDRFEGSYITAEDVGTTTQDMVVVRSATRFVSGIPREGRYGGDPAPFTAYGVFTSIRAAVRSVLGRTTLEGTTVAIQGLGAVGSRLCAQLAGAGAHLWVADPDWSKVSVAVERWGAKPTTRRQILSLDVDVLSPCAIGGVLNSLAVESVRAKIVAGAANNQLATLGDGDRLHARGICYLPDFLINAGGVISVAHEYLGSGTEERVQVDVARIADRVEEVLERVRLGGVPPARVAAAWAQSKLKPWSEQG